MFSRNLSRFISAVEMSYDTGHRVSDRDIDEVFLDYDKMVDRVYKKLEQKYQRKRVKP